MCGANETGLLDAYLNRGRTSTCQRRALREARIDPDVCVWWNASPYHLGYKGKIHDDDCVRGAHYLRSVLGLCGDLRVLVAMGDSAQAVADLVWRDAKEELPPLIPAPHPLIYGRGALERKAKLATDLRKAARLIRG